MERSEIDRVIEFVESMNLLLLFYRRIETKLAHELLKFMKFILLPHMLVDK